MFGFFRAKDAEKVAELRITCAAHVCEKRKLEDQLASFRAERAAFIDHSASLQDENAKLWLRVDVCDKLKAQVDSLQAERAAFVDQWESLQDENKKAVARVGHAQHCYEQCEADRQALAKERDIAVLIAKSTVNALIERHAVARAELDKHFPEPKDAADA